MLITVTLSIFAFSIIIGSIYSHFVLNSEALKGHKIQAFRRQTGVFKEHFPLIAFNVISLATITALSLYFLQGIFDMKLPTIGLFLLEAAALIFIDDAYMYFFHKLMHKNAFLFKTIHKIHHRACPPFPLDFMYVHPLEWFGGSFGAVIGILLFYIIFGEVNVYAFWAFGIFRNLHEVEIHSGLKSVIAQYIPFLGLTEHHEYHHIYLDGNYGSSFTFWDKFFQTQIKETKKK